MSAAAIDIAAFRDAFSAVPMPVSIVTALHDERVWATTVSSFCSLSASPPLVLVALHGRSDTLSAAVESGRFGVNVLSHRHVELAQRCAAIKGPGKLTAEEWRECDGLPAIRDAAVWVACELTDVHAGGDHRILVGLITGVRVPGHDPILYHQRTFAKLAPGDR